MRLEYQILAAVALDLVLGDPRWLPHPTRGIGGLAAWLEPRARRWIGPPRLAGIATALAVYATAGLGVWLAIWLAHRAHPLAGDAVAVVAIYTTIAARDLSRHSMAVFHALSAGDLVEARRRVGFLVGRDTLAMDEAEVVRAALESVGESTVDGVTAPLFYAVLAGPVGAMVYRAINTLDSMFGHLDQRYQQFGWAAARVDDLANYLPARLTAPLVCVAAMVFGEKGMKTLESQVACGTLDTAGGLSTRAACHTAGQASSDAQRNREAMAGLAALDPPRITLHALRILARDGRKHASPNSGLAEAAMAGALGVQLGGVNYYGGEAMQRAKIGDPLLPLAARQIPRANTLMWTAAALFLVICLTARAGVVYCCHRAPHPVVSRGSVSIEQKTIVRVPLAACPPVSAGHGQASCPWHPCSLVMPSSPAVALPRGTSA